MIGSGSDGGTYSYLHGCELEVLHGLLVQGSCGCAFTAFCKAASRGAISDDSIHAVKILVMCDDVCGTWKLQVMFALSGLSSGPDQTLSAVDGLAEWIVTVTLGCS